MSESSFSIEAHPVPAARPRTTARGTFYPKKHSQYKTMLDNFLRWFDPMEKIEGPCELRFLFVMPRYKTSDHPVHRADVDNLSKLPMDCMTKSEKFYTDDDMVVVLKSYKRFAREGEEPHTKVRLISIDQDYNDFVDREFHT